MSEVHELSRWLDAHRHLLQTGIVTEVGYDDQAYRPSKIRGPGSDIGEQHDCVYGEDEDQEEYVTILCELPEGVYAEIEGGTFAELVGFRIYLHPDDDPRIRERGTR